jgi:hypothetical protein
MTTAQVDTLQRIARRLDAASLAINGLGQDQNHDAVAELVHDAARDLEAVAAPPARMRG